MSLELCLEHKQEWKQSHYAPHNCAHCKLLKENEELRKDIEWILSKSRAKSSFCTKTWKEKVASFYEVHKLGEAK